jgi:putative FmdB family regulatory protein
MPMYEMDCMECGHNDTYLVKSHEDAPKEECKGCGVIGHLQMKLTTFGSYAIKGNNSASVTPKKYRGGRS